MIQNQEQGQNLNQLVGHGTTKMPMAPYLYVLTKMETMTRKMMNQRKQIKMGERVKRGEGVWRENKCGMESDVDMCFVFP